MVRHLSAASERVIKMSNARTFRGVFVYRVRVVLGASRSCDSGMFTRGSTCSPPLGRRLGHLSHAHRGARAHLTGRVREDEEGGVWVAR